MYDPFDYRSETDVTSICRGTEGAEIPPMWYSAVGFYGGLIATFTVRVSIMTYSSSKPL